jgi:hypothetical protein
MAHQHHTKFPVCPNCNYHFEGTDNFCPNCGQENHDVNIPASHLFLELLENTLHFDTKFFRTVTYLLFRPGKLTTEFIQNRRVAYVPPFRLYVFISFIYFFLLSLDFVHEPEPEKLTVQLTPEDQAQINSVAQTTTSRRKILLANIIRYRFTEKEIALVNRPDNQKAIDSMLVSRGIQPGAAARFGLKQWVRFSMASPEERDHKIQKYISLLMFILMPLFAFLLKLIYFRQRRYYIEYLIFSIHFHCFIFVLFTLAFIPDILLRVNSHGPIQYLLILIYLFVALRSVFRQSRAITFLKLMVINILYGSTYILFLLLAFLFTVAFI